MARVSYSVNQQRPLSFANQCKLALEERLKDEPLIFGGTPAESKVDN